MKPNNYYIGYFLNMPLCASTKTNAIKSYLTNNRKLKPTQYDILPAYGDILKEMNTQDGVWLIEHNGIYITEKELRIIARDWRYFLDDMQNTVDNLICLREYTNKSTKSINKTIDLCREVINEKSVVQLEAFDKFLTNHHLVNMDMSTYAAYVKNYPGYYEDQLF